jgi:hypothetical protein
MTLQENETYRQMTGNTNYRPYEFAKRGLFSVPKKDGVYNLGTGWEEEIVEREIIGEDDHLYVTSVGKSEYGFWVGDKVVKAVIDTEHGIHKSRFIRWTCGQLTIEDLINEIK